MHYQTSHVAACFASGCTFWGSLKQRPDRTGFQDSMFSGCCWHKRSAPCVFCEKTIMLTFVDVVFCPSEIKAASEMGVRSLCFIVAVWLAAERSSHT